MEQKWVDDMNGWRDGENVLGEYSLMIYKLGTGMRRLSLIEPEVRNRQGVNPSPEA